MVLSRLSFLQTAFTLLSVHQDGTMVVSGEKVLLRGKGASFPEIVYNSWLPSFAANRQDFVDLDAPYDATGSGLGKTAIKEGPSVVVEYAGSDSLLDPSDYVTHADLKMFPTMAGAVVVVYNIPELKATLHLTREQLVGIYNGTFTHWNDSSLQESNPGANLPNETILVVARADKSGTTDMFTETLCLISEEWKNRPREGRFSKGRNETTGEPYHWDPNVIKYFGVKTKGVSGLILSIKYTIGYLSVADVHDTKGMKYADLQNKAGHYVEASAKAVQTSMEYYSKHSNSLTVSIADGPDDTSYPIAGYTYFIVYMHSMPYCDRAVELVRYVEWFMTDSWAREECIEKSMVPLSPILIKNITENILKQMTCGPDKANVWELMTEQKADEYWQTQTWRTPVAVTTSLLIAVLCGICIYFVYQHFKLRKMIDSNEWDIPIEEITFYFDERFLSAEKSKFVGYQSVKSFKSLGDIPEGMELLAHILQWPGKWKANHVGLRLLEVKSLSIIHRETKKTMLWMRDAVIHPNVLRFFGLTELESDRYVLSEYCAKGPMTDILQDDKYNFTSDFKFSLSNDIASGLYYLHAQNIVHGNLKSSCCLIDSRWNVKIADWEYCKLLSLQEPMKNPVAVLNNKQSEQSKHVAAFIQFWTDPEIVRSEYKHTPSSSSDVYSFSVILQEIFTREDPYSEHADLISPEEVMRAVLNNGLRPQYSSDTPVGVRQIMEIGWADEPSQRPSMEQILKMLRHANPVRKSMLDNMMEAMEEYTAHLEERIEERTSELMVAKQNMETVLSGVIPPHIASKIANGQTVTEEEYKSMAVLSAEIVDFPDVTKLTTASDAVAYLNELNGELETVIKKYEIFCASVQGDSYILVSGFNVTDKTIDDSAAVQIAHLALDIMATASKLPQASFLTQPLSLRYGADAGRVVGALVGASSPRYCLLGGTVKTAILLKNTSCPNKIQISEPLQSILSKRGFHTDERSSVSLRKGGAGGAKKTYWLTGRDNTYVDTSSDLSADSGISVVSVEKSASEKNSKGGVVVQTVSVDIENPGTVPSYSKSPCESSTIQPPVDKWRHVFPTPTEQPRVSVRSERDIELHDLSPTNESERSDNKTSEPCKIMSVPSPQTQTSRNCGAFESISPKLPLDENTTKKKTLTISPLVFV